MESAFMAALTAPLPPADEPSTESEEGLDTWKLFKLLNRGKQILLTLKTLAGGSVNEEDVHNLIFDLAEVSHELAQVSEEWIEKHPEVRR